MGRALIIIASGAAAALASAPATAAADPPATAAVPDIAVAVSCEPLIDRAAVAVALRVELRQGGAAPADQVSVDCPAGDAVVVELGDRTAQVAVSDVAPTARARVVALAVAEQLRPESTPATAEVTLVPPDRPGPRGLTGWTFAARVEGVAAKETNVATASAVVAHRWGRAGIEAGLGFLAGGGASASRLVGVIGDLRLVVSVLRVGRTDVGLAAGVLGAATYAWNATGTGREAALAGRGEARAEFDLGATRWRGMIAIGAGRALGNADWFATIALGAVVGL